MRRKTFLVLLFILISVIIMSCQSQHADADIVTAKTITKVSISKSNGFSNVNPKFFEAYEDEESLQVFAGMISSAVRVSGIVDIAAPEFDVEVTYDDGSTQGYHLWVGESGYKSTIMKVENTHTIYTVPASITDKLIKLVQ